jgi:hypothetical protein
MAYESTIENIINALMTFFENNIDTYLDAITEEKDDSITLDSFREYERDDSDPYLRKVYPSAQFYSTNIIDRYLTTGKNEVIITANILMTIKTGTEIVTKMDRYCEALRQMINDDESLNGGAEKLGPEITINQFPTVEGKKTALVTLDIIKVVNHKQS